MSRQGARRSRGSEREDAEVGSHTHLTNEKDCNIDHVINYDNSEYNFIEFNHLESTFILSLTLDDENQKRKAEKQKEATLAKKKLSFKN